MTARVHYFGTQPLSVQGEPHRLKLSGASRSLFLYLLVHARREWRRDFLAEQFWPSSIPRRQKSCLNSAVWRIKNQLELIPGIDLCTRGHQLRLLLDSTVSIDLEEMALLVRQQGEAVPEPAVARRLQKLLAQGHASWLDHLEEDWVPLIRERAFNLRVRGLTLLMHWHSHEHRYEEALEIGRNLVADDPTREALQCSVLWLYVLNGQRAQAMRHYDGFRRWLDAELGIEPMPETQALHEYICRGLNAQRATPLPGARTAGGCGNRPEDLPSLQCMVAAVEQSRQAFLKDLERRVD